MGCDTQFELQPVTMSCVVWEHSVCSGLACVCVTGKHSMVNIVWVQRGTYLMKPTVHCEQWSFPACNRIYLCWLYLPLLLTKTSRSHDDAHCLWRWCIQHHSWVKQFHCSFQSCGWVWHGYFLPPTPSVPAGALLPTSVGLKCQQITRVFPPVETQYTGYSSHGLVLWLLFHVFGSWRVLSDANSCTTSLGRQTLYRVDACGCMIWIPDTSITSQAGDYVILGGKMVQCCWKSLEPQVMMISCAQMLGISASSCFRLAIAVTSSTGEFLHQCCLSQHACW